MDLSDQLHALAALPPEPPDEEAGWAPAIVNACREEDIPFSSLGIELQFLCRPACSLL